MTPALVLALVAAVQQPSIPARQRLDSARLQFERNKPESAAVLLRSVAEASDIAPADRLEAWMLLGIVTFYTTGDSAAAAAFRAALAIDPRVQVDNVDSGIAAILEGERATLASRAAPEPQLYDCLTNCPEGMEPPRFTYFPRLEFVEAAVRGTRRMRTHLIFRAVIRTDGTIDPATLRVAGGTAGETERQLRQGLAQARFAPGRLHGRPVSALVLLRFDFAAEGTAWTRYTYRVVTH